ncbi:Stp1/IreP family PP2C-type Ser/Thr phosphatase [Dehalococcoidia bacterium]|nr:Stp1/IreP family PP2C-type Ser/Thr phosphatase [Dehalococcoidia bacterium]
MTNLFLDAVAKSDVGLVRKNNEDSYLCITDVPTSEYLNSILIVADGMGGHSAGEVASQMAVDYLSDSLDQASFNTDEDPKGYSQMLAKLLQQANTEVYEAGRSQSRFNMGTTCSVLIKTGNIFSIAHVGDSRIYLMRNGKFKQLTNDHTWVCEQIISGNLTKDESLTHPYRNILTKAIGTSTAIEVDHFELEAQHDDLLLMCSDGLSTLVNDDVIRSIIQDSDIEKASSDLIEKAKENGGDDNITVILGKVTGRP